MSSFICTFDTVLLLMLLSCLWGIPPPLLLPPWFLLSTYLRHYTHCDSCCRRTRDTVHYGSHHCWWVGLKTGTYLLVDANCAGPAQLRAHESGPGQARVYRGPFDLRLRSSLRLHGRGVEHTFLCAAPVTCVCAAPSDCKGKERESTLSSVWRGLNTIDGGPV